MKHEDREGLALYKKSWNLFVKYCVLKVSSTLNKEIKKMPTESAIKGK